MPSVELRAKASLDGSGFQAGLTRMERGIGVLKSHIASAFTVGAVTAFAKEVIRFASEIKDSADRLGVTTAQIQEFQHAAEQSSASLDLVATALEKIARGAEDIKAGKSGDLAKAFERLGVASETLANGSPGEIFKEIGKYLEAHNVTAQVTADIYDAMGRSGTKLIPTLKELEQLSSAKRNSAGFISDAEIKKLEAAGDWFSKMKNDSKGIAAHLMTGLGELVDLKNLFAGSTDFVNQEKNVAEKQSKLDARKKDEAAGVAAAVKAQVEIQQSAIMSDLVDFITGAEPEIEKEKSARLSSPRGGDELTSVGNFLGSRQDAISRIAERQLSVLQSIDRGIARLAENQDQTGYVA